MRALCLSDVHREVSAARRLGATALVGGIDLILSAGDLGVDGTNEAAVYELLSSAGVPVFSVPGNHDGDDEYDELAARFGWTDLHERVIERDGWWFAGFGLRGWDGVADFASDVALEGLLSRLEGIPPRRLVLLTHVPPFNTLAARDRHFVDRGSPQLADWIGAWQPAACVCGHVHHGEPVTDRFGETVVVNPGPYGYVLAL